MVICYVSKTTIGYSFLAFIGIQLQGTLYNYYYVIIRNQYKGSDKTSRIIEGKTPKAFPNERQKIVNILFFGYKLFYGIFDDIIYHLDRKAVNVQHFPNWFMSLISIYGLGFQLLIMAVMLSCNWIDFIVPFFIFYTILLVVFVGIRRHFIL